MIPDSWKRVRVKDIATVSSGGTPDRNIAGYWNGSIPWVTTGQIDFNIIERADEFITEEGYKNSSTKLFPKGTILMAMYGQGATRGKVARLGIVATTNQACAGIKVHENIDNAFLFYYLASKYRELRYSAHGSHQDNLNGEIIKNFFVLLPPIPEQHKIAEVLSTWDEAIAASERLLSALRARKKGLMQRLLTGQVRFAGFGGEWKEVQIGKLVKEVNRPIEWDDDAIYNLISVRRRSCGLFLREQRKGCEIKTKDMKVALAGDFLISKMQIVHGASGLTTQEFDGMHISGSYVSLIARDQKTLDIRFFDLLSKTPNFYRLTYLSSYGVHIEKMTFNLKDFFKRTIHIPPSIEEQRKIVEIFGEAEKEIKLNEQQLEALKQQKKGLMQRLLTGQVRV